MYQSFFFVGCILVALLLNGCSATKQSPASISKYVVLDTASMQAFNAGADQSQQVWVQSFGWRCNAEGGYLQSYCYDLTEAPDAKSGVFPPGLLHCKTEEQIIKRDLGTLAGWRTVRRDNDVIAFQYVIRANSPIFGPGREIEVVYRHTLIRREDQNAIGLRLGCDFALRGGDAFP